MPEVGWGQRCHLRALTPIIPLCSCSDSLLLSPESSLTSGLGAPCMSLLLWARVHWGHQGGAGVLIWVPQIVPTDTHPENISPSPKKPVASQLLIEKGRPGGNRAFPPHLSDQMRGNPMFCLLVSCSWNVSSASLQPRLPRSTSEATPSPTHGPPILHSLWSPSSAPPSLSSLTGCCRTTSWEGSPPRRCGSCRACSLCESVGATWMRLPGPVTAPHPHPRPWPWAPCPNMCSWLWFLWGFCFLYHMSCVHTHAFGGTQAPPRAVGTGPPCVRPPGPPSATKVGWGLEAAAPVSIRKGLSPHLAALTPGLWRGVVQAQIPIPPTY